MLVLTIGDLHIPDRSTDLPEKVRVYSLLATEKKKLTDIV